MTLFYLVLLFLGISLPLLFAGYIIIRSRVILATFLIRKSFWIGMSFPLIYLTLLIVIHRFFPEIYTSFALLRTNSSLVSAQDSINIFILLLVTLAPGGLIACLSCFWGERLQRIHLLSTLAAGLCLAAMMILLLSVFQNIESVQGSIIVGSVVFIAINALSEESNKAIFARVVGGNNRSVLILLSLIVALGFAFCENIIYVLVEYAKTSSLAQVSNLMFARTFFSMGIHIVSIFIAIGLFFGTPKTMYFFHPNIVLGLLFAIFFHASANMLLELQGVFSLCILSVVIFFGVSFGFYRINKIFKQSSDSIGQATL